MSGAPQRSLDPICDMIVDLAVARDAGLTIERPEREYAFCSHGCLVRFSKAQTTYIPKVEAWLAAEARGEHERANAASGDPPAIDEGMRRWHASCPCCLSEAYPDVAKMLDAEKAAATGH